MTAGSWLLGAATGLLALTTTVTAQTLPVPVLPPETTPGATPTPPPKTPTKEPLPAPVEAAARPRPWEYSLGLGAGWDSNMIYPNPGGPSGASLVPRGALARLFWSPRGQLRAGVTGTWFGYADRNQPNRSYADVSLDGSYRVSRSTTFSVGAFYGLGYSDSSRVLLEQGVLLPVVETRTFAGSLGLSQRMGTRTSLKIDARIFRTEFDSADLVDGESGRGTIALERRLGLRSAASFVYSLENTTDPSGGSYLTHFGSLQWSRILSTRSAFLLEAGASYTPEADRAGLGRNENFFGGVTLRRKVKRSSLTAFVRREVTPAFGTGGSRLDFRMGLSAAIPLGQAWDFRTAASYVIPETPPGAQGAYGSSADASLGLGRRLGRHLQVSAEGSYRYAGGTSAFSTQDAFRASLYLTVTPAVGR